MPVLRTRSLNAGEDGSPASSGPGRLSVKGSANSGNHRLTSPRNTSVKILHRVTHCSQQGTQTLTRREPVGCVPGTRHLETSRGHVPSDNLKQGNHSVTLTGAERAGDKMQCSFVGETVGR